jgi:uncharacterized membrane protein
MVQRKVELGKKKDEVGRLRLDDILKDADKKDKDELLENLVLYSLNSNPRSVKDIITTVKTSINGRSDLRIEDDEIIYAIKRLEYKHILLYNSKADTLTKFIKDFYLSMTLWLVAISTCVTLLAVYVIPDVMPWSIVRVISGGVFVLFIPGYALVQLLFPKKEMDMVERIAFSIGLSLAVVPLVGFLLNYSPWGIRLDPIVASISALSMVLALASVYRRYLINRDIIKGNET